jgi:hypothetical protein
MKGNERKTKHLLLADTPYWLFGLKVSNPDDHSIPTHSQIKSTGSDNYIIIKDSINAINLITTV